MNVYKDEGDCLLRSHISVSVLWNFLNLPSRLDSFAVQENVALHAVTRRQPLLQQRGELLRELLPVLFPHLVLETMQDLEKKKKKNAVLHTFISSLLIGMELLEMKCDITAYEKNASFHAGTTH